MAAVAFRSPLDPAFAQTYPMAVTVRWTHPDPATVDEWVLFVGTGPDCPLVGQQPAVVIPVDPAASQPFEYDLVVSEQTCVVIGARNGAGMAIDPTVWAYPVPWRGDCDWWAARDTFPVVLGIADARGLGLADRVYFWGMFTRTVWRVGGFACW